MVTRLLEIKAKSKVTIQFRIQVEHGEVQSAPPKDVVAEVAMRLSGKPGIVGRNLL